MQKWVSIQEHLIVTLPPGFSLPKALARAGPLYGTGVVEGAFECNLSDTLNTGQSPASGNSIYPAIGSILTKIPG